MRSLLQHASRSLPVALKAPSRPLQSLPLSICLRCQYRVAETPLSGTSRALSNSTGIGNWSRRDCPSSTRWMEERGPGSRPIQMPPPSTQSTPARQGRVEDTAPEVVSSLEGQERLQEAPDALIEKETYTKSAPAPPPSEKAPETLSSLESQERLQEQSSTTSGKHDVQDNIARVPDEHLPSHRDKQRWTLSKRLAEAMDEILPKLALVTQKVNTYTGTDYSGVEALRREIKEQEKLVKARHAAITTAKQTLDTVTAKQASAQKEVVSLLERKHSWVDGDLERYMSLIRSEHVNDQAVREAKEAVFTAESALEEARNRLEKRERAQYHEEQIWSDTIRRNSTWVTFGLMGVNIFLLLLSLLILEPWRRRRMVREIKNTLEAQTVAMQAAPVAALPPAAAAALSDIAAIEAEIDKVADSDAAAEKVLRAKELEIQQPVHVPVTPVEEKAPPQEKTIVEDDILPPPEPKTWQEKVAWIAQDIISDRVISIRRVDYTTAILQGAAAGAVITATIIAMLRPN